MAILRAEEIRKMKKKELLKRLGELRRELMRLRGQIASGAPPENPGKVREIRRTIARILTLLREKYGDL